MITINRVSENEFTEMRAEWNALLTKSECESPMLTWEWMHTWWQCYRAHEVSRSLYLLAARNEREELIGIAPLLLRNASIAGIRLKRIEFIGTGESEKEETCSEFLDLIVDPGNKTDIINEYVEYLSKDLKWDELILKDVRSESSASADGLWAGFSNAIFQKTKTTPAKCPFVSLTSSWDEYLETITEKRAIRVKYERRRLERDAKVEFFHARTRDEIENVFPEFVRLHQSLWSARGKEGCFSRSIFENFLKEVCRKMVDKSGVDISCLKVNGDLVAVYVIFVQGDKSYYYNSGVIPDKYPKYSLGNVTLAFILEDAIKQGIREFHFFKGGDESYKYHWTSKSVSVCDYLIRRKNLKCNAVTCFERLKNDARKSKKIIYGH